MHQSTYVRTWGLPALVLLLATAIAPAQFSDDFESLTASAAGTPAAGQGGYYIPPVAGSSDFEVYTYSGNTLGVPVHPIAGGTKFMGGTNAGSIERTQHAVPFSVTNQVWRATFDICCLFSGTGTPLNNLSSFSLQPSATAKHFIALARWPVGGTGATWDADFVYFTAGGTSVTGAIPNPGFQGLQTSAWYRWEVSWRFDTNRILEIRLIDLAASTIAYFAPADWYLFGGAAGTPALPTDFRLFVGGGTGNAAAFDNVVINWYYFDYQANQPEASLDIDGGTSDSARPIEALRTLYQPSAVNLASTLAGFPHDVAVTLGGLLPLGTGGIATSGGQVLNVNPVDPTLTFLYGGTFTTPFQPLSLTLPIPFEIDLQAQMVVVSPSNPDGVALSAPNVLRVKYAEGEHFRGQIQNLSALSSHAVNVRHTPAPATFDDFASSANIPPVSDGQMSLDYQDPFGAPIHVTQIVQVDNVTQQLLVNGFPVQSLAQVFSSFLPPSLGPAQFEFLITVPIQLEIVGLALQAAAPCYVTDGQWLPPGFVGPPAPPQKVVSSADGHPTTPDCSQARSDAGLAALFPGGNAMIMQTGGPTDSYDCHGFTFAGGARWINDDQVQKIIDDNCYMPVAAGGVMMGDVVVYRDAAGNITHSGIVTMVDGTGMATQIESKWGRRPRYTHPPGRVPPAYGMPTYYRSTRAGGHTLHSAP